jgi:nucleotide-binding universal stress UspA family protein
MFKRILLALDGSENAEKALPWVRLYAARDKALVILTRATNPGYVIDDGRADEEYREAQEYLQGIERQLNYHGIPSKTVVRPATAPMALLSVAMEERCDLVVMTTRGGSKIRRWLVGGVTEQVLRASPIPVLVVRSRTPLLRQARVSRILVPVDGSSLSLAVVPWAERLARHHKASIVFLRVVPHGLPASSPRYERAMAALHERVLLLRDRLQRKGVRSELHVETGDPADRILRARCELIAMTTHGYGGFKRWLMGSVAEKVVHEAIVPVFVYRGTASRRLAAHA